MRRHLVWLFALASVAVIAVAAIASAASSNTTTASVKVKPSTLSKTKFKPIKLTIGVTTLKKGDPGTPTHPTLFPSPSKKTDVALDGDFKFTTKGLATCAAAKLVGTTSSQALAACGKAKVGSGHATACASNGAGSCALAVPAQVLAFNGKPKAGNPTLLLWTSNAVTGQTTLPGVIKPTSGKFSHTLFVKVPPLGGGAGSITDFKTTVSRKYTVKGKTRHYTTARCSHKSLGIQATFKFTDGTTSKSTASAKCTT